MNTIASIRIYDPPAAGLSAALHEDYDRLAYEPFRSVEHQPLISDVQGSLIGRVWREFIHCMQRPAMVFRPTGEPAPAYKPQIEFSSPEALRIEQLRLYRVCESQAKRWDVTYEAPVAVCRAMRGRETEIIDHGIVAVPNKRKNIWICRSLAEMFGPRLLLSVAGFSETFVDLNDAGPPVSQIQVDIDPKLEKKGFMMPVLVSGQITGMQVFRSVDDPRPFVLRTRRRFNVG